METREKQLADAKVQSETADLLMAQFKTWEEAALKLCPMPWCYGNKREQNKHRTIHALFERVCAVQRKYRALVIYFNDQDSEYERKAKQEKYEAERKAIVWLLARGKKYLVDFGYDNVLFIANQIAYEEECTRLQAIPEMYSFDGDDNCEDCPGWDGVDHRCECGNRRVHWEMNDYHTFEKPSVRAVAY